MEEEFLTRLINEDEDLDESGWTIDDDDAKDDDVDDDVDDDTDDDEDDDEEEDVPGEEEE